jgi:O-succinylbenzoate synthase
MDVVTRWTLYEFALQCQPPFETRKGMVLKIEHPDERIGWGEISPLPGRSQESLAQAKRQLLALLKHNRQPKTLYPSVSIGWEHAHHINTPINTQFPLCALLTGTRKQILEKAESVYSQGYRTVKVKVSNLSFIDAYEVLSLLSSQFSVRVDVNQAWSFGEALSFFSRFAQDAFEFIEEPTSEIDKLSLFTHPFALDESLLQLTKNELSTFSKLKALVLKPTIIGNQKKCARYQTLAQELNLLCVLSSAFESGLGISQICALSHTLGIENIPLGLDTYRLLKEDLLIPPLDFSKPHLTIPKPIEINSTLLKEIAHG